MKKLIFIAILFGIIATGCTSPEKKAQNLIKDKLKETLHDWSSYESVKFGTLDSVYTTIWDNDQYVSYTEKYIKYAKQLKKSMEEVESYEDMYSNWALSKKRAALENAQFNLDSVNFYKPKMEELEENFSPDFKGWGMTHSYRANNAGGNKVIGHYMFHFDKDMTKVIDSVDISKSDDD